MFTTPVLLLVFNRPETTQKVFEKIRLLQPSFLYVAADGPRENILGEKETCEEVRNLVLTNIDWDCEVKTLLRNENLGCGRAVSQAITWFFEHVEEGIILEDDTIPDSSFFKYCENLLRKYRKNESVMHISGCYFLKNYENLSPNSNTYFFTKHIHVWGWATWKRAWKRYDFSMKGFTTNQLKLKKYYKKYYGFWNNLYSQTYGGKIDTWDYQWMYSICLKNGIAINPTINLIQNIGFNEDATHTKDKASIYNSIPIQSISKYNHPSKIKIDTRRDDLYYRHFLDMGFKKNKFSIKRIVNYSKRIFGNSEIYNDLYKVSNIDLVRLKSMPRYQATEFIFFGNSFNIVDADSFLSSYNEIFIQEIYKFKTATVKPIIIDCGANIGLATIYLKMKYPNARLLSFEPDPHIFRALENNINSFKLDDVELYNEAIGAKRESLFFNMEGGHSGMLVAKPSKETITLPVTPLKEILEKFSVIDFLKIDIEGHEINVLPSIAEELKKVNVMFLEYHTFLDQPQQLSVITKIIEDAGLRYYIKEAAFKKSPFLERELFYKMDMLVNIFCYRD